MHGKSFSAELLAREFPATADEPHNESTLIQAAQRLGFKVKAATVSAKRVADLPLPLLVTLQSEMTAPAFVATDRTEKTGTAQPPSHQTLALITAASGGKVVLFRAGENQPQTHELSALDAMLTGQGWLFAPEVESTNDADAPGSSNRSTSAVTQSFGFKWFTPELLRHRRVWRDVLLASLALQIVALATPLFTQAIIDKVVVHRTQSTLIAIGIAMASLSSSMP